MARALVLFAHGARAQSWAAPFERLRDQAQARMPEVRVTLAFLELMEPRLPEAMDALVLAGVDEVTVLPVFLGQGGHVLRDLPQIVETIRAAHPGLRLEIVGAIGEDPQVQAAMTEYCVRSLG
ncbi:sirohydrochlorin chelatase [Massilia yuzhufengensis]|uniref:Sirohydrochlorin cobaltochelatase n=1 Tax=Massilia yuzhufengensis TaxID=1164594 RepID=A0A1I1K818_9BURK|nr:CbiX/SirB N-terminal domain-containing protein [Massilia yuzhufengensis]SFC56964.1 sirohydrochlorin cobaltochelatase [Massilia yuzhufengensis]